MTTEKKSRQLEIGEMDQRKDLNLWQKLLEIKKGVPYMQKDAKSYNYSYASGTQVLSKINQLANELGVMLVPEVTSFSAQPIVNSKGKTEQLYLLNMTMTWVNVDNQNEREICSWAASGVNGEEKGYGSALTYAERYFMLKYFNIPTDELDPDKLENTVRNQGGAITIR